jgi:hypothetical protein
MQFNHFWLYYLSEIGNFPYLIETLLLLWMVGTPSTGQRVVRYEPSTSRGATTSGALFTTITTPEKILGI